MEPKESSSSPLFNGRLTNLVSYYDAEMAGDEATAVCLIGPKGCHFCIIVATRLVNLPLERGEEEFSFGSIPSLFTYKLRIS